MRFEPTYTQVYVADRGRIARLRWLPEIEGCHHHTPGGQGPIDPDIIVPIPVVPCTAVHVDDGRKGSGSFGLIDASQLGLATLVVILDVLFVYFEFAVACHAANLQRGGYGVNTFLRL